MDYKTHHLNTDGTRKKSGKAEKKMARRLPKALGTNSSRSEIVDLKYKAARLQEKDVQSFSKTVSKTAGPIL